MSEDHTRTVSNAHYMEVVAKAMFMDSIMVVLGVRKPQDALPRVKGLMAADAMKVECPKCGTQQEWDVYQSVPYCPTCR